MHRLESAEPCSRDLRGPVLASSLREARERSLLHLSRWREVAGPDARLPLHAHFNPPAWEAGHVAWFQEFWIARNPQCLLGELADPDCARPASRMAGADALYDSGRVAHDARWSLALPPHDHLAEWLCATLDETLAKLPGSGQDDRSLYFHRLALFHEDMHSEAAIYMANHYGAGWNIDTGVFAPEPVPSAARPGAPPRASAEVASGTAQRLSVPAGPARLGRGPTGFAFDNELPCQLVHVEDFDIDTRLVDAAGFLAFAAAGGYRERRWWSAQGWQFAQALATPLPRFHRERDGTVERCCFGQWRPLAPHEPMLHVNAHEAEAWCRWAGRSLPSEAQWMRAATCPEFTWGQAWEWTSEPFAGFTGFAAHPYRDYSQPWFGDHRLLKGASAATTPRMRHAAYRNFYLPTRSDIFCGFRSCSPPPAR